MTNIYMNRLCLVTWSSNSIGKEIIEQCLTAWDEVIGVSRTWYDIKSDLYTNFRGDLTVEKDLEDLKRLLQTKHDNSKEILFFHTAGKVKNEFNDKNDHRFHTIDKDWDGIDDEVLKWWYITLQNTLKALETMNWKVHISRINALSNKKSYIPSCSKSMTLTNRKIEEYIISSKYNSSILHVWTIWTHSEINHRKYSLDKDYRLNPKDVAKHLINMAVNNLESREIYVHHPEYKQRFEKEDDQSMRNRFWMEITWKKY